MKSNGKGAGYSCESESIVSFGWFAHVERMNEYRVARRVLMAEICGERLRLRLS